MDAKLLAEAVDELLEKIASLQRELADTKAALNKATEDRMKFIDYSSDLQRIIEDLCQGREIRVPKTSARWHYNMAVEKDKEIEALREAVEPFSRLASVLCAGDADDAIVIGVSAGDLRRLVNAQRALEGGEANG